MISTKTALITGVSGQDGSYLAELLLQTGYEVIGITRDPASARGQNIAHLGGKFRLLYSSYELISLIDLLTQTRPSEVYNCAGQTYVNKSWEMLDDTFHSSAMLPTNLLEAIARVNKDIRFFQASSCEVFSLGSDVTFTEQTPLAPGSPYGCSKAFAQNMVACFRKNYGIYAVNGILFHHESPRRHENFVSRKIVKRAVSIKLGKETELTLGNMDVFRDWGFAPDVAIAIRKMMQMEQPQDLIICSGESHSLRELVRTVFELLNLDYEKYTRTHESFHRATEPAVIRGSNEKAKGILDWQPKTSFRGMLEKMVDYEMRLQTKQESNFLNERPFQ